MTDTTTRSEPIRSDEKAATAPTARALKWLVSAVAISMSLYHMYVAAFGPPLRYVRGPMNFTATYAEASVGLANLGVSA